MRNLIVMESNLTNYRVEGFLVKDCKRYIEIEDWYGIVRCFSSQDWNVISSTQVAVNHKLERDNQAQHNMDRLLDWENLKKNLTCVTNSGIL